MARKGGIAISMGISLGFFIVYWIFLISGEEFADRGQLSPFIAMWMPNFILGLLGIFLNNNFLLGILPNENVLLRILHNKLFIRNFAQ